MTGVKILLLRLNQGVAPINRGVSRSDPEVALIDLLISALIDLVMARSDQVLSLPVARAALRRTFALVDPAARIDRETLRDLADPINLALVDRARSKRAVSH
jgi:hypothetical protein